MKKNIDIVEEKKSLFDLVIGIIFKSKSFKYFLGKEVSIYLAQIYLFFWMTFLFSACFTSEEKLLEYLNSVITDKVVITVLYTIISSIITIGSIEFLAKGMKKSSFIKLISDDIALSIGRAMYTIGSSLSGVCIAATVFLFSTSDYDNAIKFGWSSVLLGFVLFVYGFCISYWCSKQKL
ncbi:hypothetical protein [Photobacterium kishitanii]|uniref:hypothetical protein n=1 Tax=Photobacterium kishitanii TaxID=318456 RepID=UPI0011B25CD8|nr:hypothetical protein [Photobacterium kishitanii]